MRIFFSFSADVIGMNHAAAVFMLLAASWGMGAIVLGIELVVTKLTNNWYHAN